MSESSISIDRDRSLHFRVAGEGPDIVLFHGALTTHRDWLGPPMDRLSALGRVIAVDRPGHGASRRPRFSASPREQARQIWDGLSRLGVSRPLIVGHSFGAMVALAFAELFPDEMFGLVLLSPVSFPEFRPLEQTFYGARSLPIVGPAFSALAAGTIDRPLLERLHQVMFWPHAPDPEWRRRYDWDWILGGQAGVSNGEDAAALHPASPAAWLAVRGIDAPVTILAGREDLVANPTYHGRSLAALVEQANFEILADTGHMLHRQRPERVAEAVESMLKVSLAA
jgi:pimeloyl-ACP methyl ester carboxylesterase